MQAWDTASSSLAFGCKGSELSVWSLKGERLYLSKSAKPNRIGLVDKPWNTAVIFLPGSSGRQIVVGTGQHKVRLYDLTQRRPKLSVDFGEARITALAAQSDGTKTKVFKTPYIDCLEILPVCKERRSIWQLQCYTVELFWKQDMRGFLQNVKGWVASELQLWSFDDF